MTEQEFRSLCRSIWFACYNARCWIRPLLDRGPAWRAACGDLCRRAATLHDVDALLAKVLDNSGGRRGERRGERHDAPPAIDNPRRSCVPFAGRDGQTEVTRA